MVVLKELPGNAHMMLVAFDLRLVLELVHFPACMKRVVKRVQAQAVVVIMGYEYHRLAWDP
jgi:hypothetical protein